MQLAQNWPFRAFGQVLLIDRQLGDEWKKLGIEFCSNNGWDWPGNAYILETSSEKDELESFLQRHGIDLYAHSHPEKGYATSHFGFEDRTHPYFKYNEMDSDALELCAGIMGELGIYWCGWPEAPSFTLVASEKQILELSERLKEPIAKWHQENDYYLTEAWS